MKDGASHLIKRIFFLIIGQMIPKTSAFFLALRRLQMSLFSICVAGILAGASLGMGLWLFYQLLADFGFSPKVITLLILTVLLVLLLIFANLAKLFLTKFKQDIGNLKFFASKHQDNQILIEMILAFGQGLMDKPKEEKGLKDSVDLK